MIRRFQHFINGHSTRRSAVNGLTASIQPRVLYGRRLLGETKLTLTSPLRLHSRRLSNPIGETVLPTGPKFCMVLLTD